MRLEFWSTLLDPYDTGEAPELSTTKFTITQLDGQSLDGLTYTKIEGRRVEVLIPVVEIQPVYNNLIANPYTLMSLPKYASYRVLLYDDFERVYIDGFILRDTIEFVDEKVVFYISDIFSVFVDNLEKQDDLVVENNQVTWNSGTVSGTAGSYNLRLLMRLMQDYNKIEDVIAGNIDIVLDYVNSIGIEDDDVNGNNTIYSLGGQPIWSAKYTSYYDEASDTYYYYVIWVYQYLGAVICVPIEYKFNPNGLVEQNLVPSQSPDLASYQFSQQPPDGTTYYIESWRTTTLSEAQVYQEFETVINLQTGQQLVYSTIGNESSPEYFTRETQNTEIIIRIIPTVGDNPSQTWLLFDYTITGAFTFNTVQIEDGEYSAKQFLKELLLLTDTYLYSDANIIRLKEKNTPLDNPSYTLPNYCRWLYEGLSLQVTVPSISIMSPDNTDDVTKIVQKYYDDQASTRYKIKLTVNCPTLDYEIGDIVAFKSNTYKIFGIDLYNGLYKLKIYGSSFNKDG
jgi:hypothetical protein